MGEVVSGGSDAWVDEVAELTVDVVFGDVETFQHVKATGVLCAALFARLYSVPQEHVLFTPYDAAFAFKATFPRLVPAGDFGDTDVYGCQQHAPLLDIEIPETTR